MAFVGEHTWFVDGIILYLYSSMEGMSTRVMSISKAGQKCKPVLHADRKTPLQLLFAPRLVQNRCDKPTSGEVTLKLKHLRVGQTERLYESRNVDNNRPVSEKQNILPWWGIAVFWLMYDRLIKYRLGPCNKHVYKNLQLTRSCTRGGSPALPWY